MIALVKVPTRGVAKDLHMGSQAFSDLRDTAFTGVDFPDHSGLRLGMKFRSHIAMELVVSLADDLVTGAQQVSGHCTLTLSEGLDRGVVIHSDEGRLLLAELAIVHRSWINISIRSKSEVKLEGQRLRPVNRSVRIPESKQVFTM